MLRQGKKVQDSDKRSSQSIGFAWASRIMTVSLEMVVPGLIGLWIDRWLGNKIPVLALIGFAVGMTTGIYHLIQIGAAENGGRPAGETRQERLP